VGEPLAGLASVFASSAPHALRGRDRDLVRLYLELKQDLVWGGHSCSPCPNLPARADAKLAENLGASLLPGLPECRFGALES
jgi:hypothetical protein